MDRPLTVAFDFDGVLAEYTGWKGHKDYGEPVYGMKALLEQLKSAGCTIIIFTTRGNSEIAEWCETHEMPYDYINRNPGIQGNNPGKPIADVYVDDRAIKFRPDSLIHGVLKRQILSFKPWWDEEETS